MSAKKVFQFYKNKGNIYCCNESYYETLRDLLNNKRDLKIKLI